MLPSPRPRRVLPALVASALAGALLPVLAAPAVAPRAGAASTYHCSGYAGCKAAGYSDAGYGAANRTMYWRMYSGHNCTNYVAFRMIQNGMSSERPWAGSGMAYNWGFAMKSITDQTPAVGAVAWWDRGVPGAGSSGHVAYVEKIVSATEIVISEDSWSGDFHWRTIYKTGTGWPTGFIHFVDRKSVVNSAAPVVSGDPVVGSTLSATPGTWKPAGTYAYQWLADGAPIAGATAPTYVATAAAAGRALAVRVTATRAGFVAGVATSAATAPVGPGVIEAVTPPTLTGDPEVEAVLTATPTTWSVTPEWSAFRWQADGKVLKDANGPTLTLDRSLVGKTIKVVEIARLAGYTQSRAETTGIGPVVEGVIQEVRPFRAYGQARLGGTLGLTEGETDPGGVTYTYSWTRDGVVIPGATGATYAPTAEDVGRQVVARVTMSKPRYAPVVRTFVMGEHVTTPSALQVTANGRKRAAVVGVRVSAVGAAPSGPVTVKVGKNTVTGTLVDGFVRVTVTGLGAGTRSVVVTYAGTDVVEASRSTAKVIVTR